MNMKKPEPDFDLEILVNSVVACKSAANAAEAALRNYLKKRAVGSSGGAAERPVPATFMAKRMVHHTDSPEGEQNGGQESAGDGGRGGRGREDSTDSQDDSRGDHPDSQDTAGSNL